MRFAKFSVLFLLLTFIPKLVSQTPTGTIEGVVTDPGGSAIVAAVVTITDDNKREPLG